MKSLKSYYFLIVSSTFALTSAVVINPEDAILEATSQSLTCPDFQLKCPNCPLGYECVYPNNEGCPGAGIPACQALDCHGVVCLAKQLSCPKECPFRCRYNGPSCCPFLGDPVCESICQTFVPCKVTPCPSACPDDCYYPSADYCCPKSGHAVCNNILLEKRSLGDKKGGLPESFECHDEYDHDHDSWGHKHKHNHNRHYEQHQKGEHKHDHYDKHQEDYKHSHEHIDKTGCSVCAKTITDVRYQLEFVIATQHPDKPIECGHHIKPCPSECPYNCIYPMNELCPFTQEPWCPSILKRAQVEEQDRDIIYNSEGYPYPYFPTYDPYYDTFTSITNHSGISSTPSFATEIPNEEPAVACPLILILCPAECPDTCLRQNVSCPFAVEGYCPGSEPPSLPSNSISDQITTLVESTLSDGAIACPMYILACPYCPSGYSCTRETCGHCPNTNVPYCVSAASPDLNTATPTVTSTLLSNFEFYPAAAYPPKPTPWKDWEQLDHSLDSFVWHAMGLFSSNLDTSSNAARTIDYTPGQLKHGTEESQDVCQKAGFVRIVSEQMLNQIQEIQNDCKDCPLLEWDTHCDNVCAFHTEKKCCIQSVCFSDE